jgi:hypothetical protein
LCCHGYYSYNHGYPTNVDSSISSKKLFIKWLFLHTSTMHKIIYFSKCGNDFNLIKLISPGQMLQLSWNPTMYCTYGYIFQNYVQLTMLERHLQPRKLI